MSKNVVGNKKRYSFEKKFSILLFWVSFEKVFFTEITLKKGNEQIKNNCNNIYNLVYSDTNETKERTIGIDALTSALAPLLPCATPPDTVIVMSREFPITTPCALAACAFNAMSNIELVQKTSQSHKKTAVN